MDGCDSHGRSCSIGWKLKSLFIKQQSILFELIAVHLREALSGKFSVQAS